MKKLLYSMLAAIAVGIAVFTSTSCSDGETYAEKKEKEAKQIGMFLDDNDFVGKINPISEEQFYAQDSTTDVSKNEFVRFREDGIYMQIVRKGEGPTMVELAKERKDSTVTRPLLCKFLEYDIEGADTTYTNQSHNQNMTSIVDKMMCTYSHYSRSYSAWFTEGIMNAAYGSVVPKGWLKPLDFIRLSKVDGEQAKVRIIVPHSSGTSNASGHVQAFYYEISYQIPPNY
ncbi:MAG: DUF4827 domain-containing protein [Bacteroidales bacterium]|nr:DUF4827 domain-containing protein [Bacteroidales bacterium]